MKRFWIVTMGVLMWVSASAQQTSILLHAGAGAIPMNTPSVGPRYHLGGHAGIQVQIPLNQQWGVASGLYWSQKRQFRQTVETESYAKTLENLLMLFGGGSFPIDSLANSFGIHLDATTTTKELITQHQLEIPVVAMYTVSKWNFQAGGYAGMLMAAKRKVETTKVIPFLQVVDVSAFDSTGLLQFILPAAESTSLKESSDTDNLVRFDAGLLLGIGYQDDRWSFGVHYAHGMIDYTSLPSENKPVHRAVRFMVGYVIHARKEEGKIILE